MQAVKVPKGRVVIREGEEGDCYYVIVVGKAVVSQETSGPREEEVDVLDVAPWAKKRGSFRTGRGQPAQQRKKAKKKSKAVAELGVGYGFGEEALISNTKRNATVTMSEDGVLMRLGRQDFEELLEKPRLQWLSAAESASKIRSGAKWLDVRSEEERLSSGALGDAVNMPLRQLRSRVSRLDKKTLYICVCTHARLAATAAYLLTGMEYRAAVLRGGIKSLR